MIAQDQFMGSQRLSLTFINSKLIQSNKDDTPDSWVWAWELLNVQEKDIVMDRIDKVIRYQQLLNPPLSRKGTHQAFWSNTIRHPCTTMILNGNCITLKHDVTITIMQVGCLYNVDCRWLFGTCIFGLDSIDLDPYFPFSTFHNAANGQTSIGMVWWSSFWCHWAQLVGQRYHQRRLHGGMHFFTQAEP